MEDTGQRITYGDNGAIREPTVDKGRFDAISPFALERIAKRCEFGGRKYGDPNNWKKGMPFSRYLDSALRHLNQFHMGLTDEDHLAAAAWNIMAIMHHQEKQEWDLDDISG